MKRTQLGVAREIEDPMKLAPSDHVSDGCLRLIELTYAVPLQQQPW